MDFESNKRWGGVNCLPFEFENHVFSRIVFSTSLRNEIAKPEVAINSEVRLWTKMRPSSNRLLLLILMISQCHVPIYSK